jgi:hypothetical protein
VFFDPGFAPGYTHLWKKRGRAGCFSPETVVFRVLRLTGKSGTGTQNIK